MSKELAVLVIHGMGSQKDDFANEMIKEVGGRVPGSERIAWKSVFWADILSKRQDNYLRRANRNNDLDFIKLRKFVVGALADASSYRFVANDSTSTYNRVHTIVRDAMKDLFENPKLLNGTVKPLVVMAHSLGGHIMSNYIWDIQKNRAVATPGDNAFEKMRRLRGMITFGCNIPLFTFALDDAKPIKLHADAKWNNYFDPDDILGYPLKAISDKYRAAVHRDIPINVGGVFASWNPAAHGKYWTDNSFTKPVARQLKKLLDG